MIKVLVGLSFIILFSSCAQVASRTAKNVDLSKYKHPYIIHSLTDGRSIDKIITRELIKLGYDASSGPKTMMPKYADVVICYQDRWTFDFTTYMIQLDLQVYSGHTSNLVAEDSYFRPSFTGGSEVDMVDVLLNRLFKPHVPPITLTPSPVEPSI
jgi:hypothetical protein